VNTKAYIFIALSIAALQVQAEYTVIGQPSVFWREGEWQVYQDGKWIPYAATKAVPQAEPQIVSEPEPTVAPEPEPAVTNGVNEVYYYWGYGYPPFYPGPHRPHFDGGPREHKRAFRNPADKADKPVGGLGRTTIGIGKQSGGIGQTTIGIGQQNGGIGKTTIGIGQPTIGIGKPTIGIGRQSGAVPEHRTGPQRR
jgi:hypothetical protein